MNEQDDEELAEALTSGSDAAFEELVRRYQASLFRLAARILGDVRDADCAVQDAFLRAYRARLTFGGRSSLHTWLTRITVNVCLDRLRRKSRLRYLHQFMRRWQHAAQWMEQQASSDTSPEDRAASSQQRRLLHRAIGELPAKQRVAFTLRYLEELSVEEVAAAMGVETGTVKSHLFRATQRVRSAVQARTARRSKDD